MGKRLYDAVQCSAPAPSPHSYSTRNTGIVARGRQGVHVALGMQRAIADCAGLRGGKLHERRLESLRVRVNLLHARGADLGHDAVHRHWRDLVGHGAGVGVLPEVLTESVGRICQWGSGRVVGWEAAYSKLGGATGKGVVEGIKSSRPEPGDVGEGVGRAGVSGCAYVREASRAATRQDEAVEDFMVASRDVLCCAAASRRALLLFDKNLLLATWCGRPRPPETARQCMMHVYVFCYPNSRCMSCRRYACWCRSAG